MKSNSYISHWLSRLFNLLTAASAALLLVVAAIWVRSYFASDLIEYQPRVDYVQHAYVIGWGKGYMLLGAEAATAPVKPLRWMSSAARRMDGAWMAKYELFHSLGIRVASRIGVSMFNLQFREIGLYLPCWFVALLSAILPAVWAARWNADKTVRRRVDEGRCEWCGYDLRATPDRCPECGRISSKQEVKVV